LLLFARSSDSIAPSKIQKRKKSKHLLKKRNRSLFPIDFEFSNNKLYVKKQSKQQNHKKKGTDTLIGINSIDLINKTVAFSSDGFNTTLRTAARTVFFLFHKKMESKTVSNLISNLMTI
jgi:hypothetical protein